MILRPSALENENIKGNVSVRLSPLWMKDALHLCVLHLKSVEHFWARDKFGGSSTAVA
jgi:hypothetical protein